MVDETAMNAVGKPFPTGGKPDGGCAENPVRSERKQRYRLLPGVWFPLKGAFTKNAPFLLANLWKKAAQEKGLRYSS